MDFSNYNLVIDSTYSATDKIVEIILKEAKEYEKNDNTGNTKLLVSPKRLIREEDITAEDEERLQPLIKEYQDLPYMIDMVLTAKKTEEDYVVLEGLEEAKAAYLANVPYCSVQTVSNN